MSERVVERTGLDDPGFARRLVGAIGWYWSIGGYAEQCVEYVERLSVVNADDPPQVQAAFLRARALLEVVELNIWSGYDTDIARSVFERVPAFDDASVEFRMKRLWIGGQLAGADGNWDRAIECHTLAVELGELSMKGSIVANTFRCLLGWTMRWSGRTSEAAACFGQALAFLPRTGTTPRWAGHSTWVVESVAGLLAEVGGVELAARLMAAAHHGRCELDAPMPYWDRPRYEPDLQRIRDQLGDPNFDEAWSSGLELDLPTAVRLAQAELIDRAST